VPLGAKIGWKSRKQEFTGVVRYCNFREIGYFVGVEFNPGSEWSSRAYKPQHLLDLKKLLR
jgi:hypothetical protein